MENPNPNPYLRPQLAATRRQVPDRLAEVEQWLDRLEDLLDEPPGEDDPYWAYDLLAGWARLQRVRPELLQQLEARPELERAERLIGDQGPGLARLALEVPHPPAWLEEAQALDASYDDVGDPAMRAEMAERLLGDLDDAELVRMMVEPMGLADPELDQQLGACAAWLAEHAEAFLAAGVFVQAVGQTLRPDLEQFHPQLARTADKYVQVLDALEAVEADLAFAGQPGLEREAAVELFRLAGMETREASSEQERSESAEARQVHLASRGERSGYARSVLPAIVADYLAKAQTPADRRQVVPGQTLSWSSPDGSWRAELKLPNLSSPEEETALRPLNFTHRADDRPATALADQPARLGGTSGRIDAGGQAHFSLAQLRTAGELELWVGEPPQLWTPETEE